MLRKLSANAMRKSFGDARLAGFAELLHLPVLAVDSDRWVHPWD